jgi:plastocyanin
MRSRLMFLPLAVLMACGGSSDSTSPTPTPGGGGGGGGGGGTVPTVTTAVNMKSNAFTPAAIKVSPSATVTWTNSDGYDHNVTFDGGTITGSGNFATGDKALAMPATAGTYAYHCTIHAGMTGSVQVQ